MILLLGSTPSPNVPLWAYVVGLLGVGGMISSVLVYLDSRRKSSGKVETSDATDLWTESSSFRKDLIAEIATLRTRLAELETELAKANTKAAELRIEIMELRRLCGVTNEGVVVIQREIAAAKADTPEAQQLRKDLS